MGRPAPVACTTGGATASRGAAATLFNVGTPDGGVTAAGGEAGTAGAAGAVAGERRQEWCGQEIDVIDQIRNGPLKKKPGVAKLFILAPDSSSVWYCMYFHR